MDQFITFFNSLASLVPVVAFGATLIAVIVDALKRAKVLPDGYAPLASSLMNVVLYAVVYFAGSEHLADVQNVVQGMTLIAPVVIGLLGSVLLTPAVHDALTKRGVGFSYPGG